MTSKLRVEILRAAPDVGVIDSLVASQTLTVIGAAPVASTAAPAPAMSIYGQVARLSVPSGAVVVTWNGTTPSDANGVRLVAGDTLRVAAPAGTVFRAVESVDEPGAEATYAETIVAVPAGAWTLVVPAAASRQRLILTDKTGLGCSWSFSAAPAAGQGNVFSTPGNPNTWVFDDPAPLDAVYVYAASAGEITVEVA